MSQAPDERLDKALSSGAPPEDAEIALLMTTAADLKEEWQKPVPPARGARALFIQGVGAQKVRVPWLRLAAPTIAGAMLIAFLAVVGLAGRTAAPGDRLYPVRKVLGSIGLAPSAREEVDRRLQEATATLEEGLAKTTRERDEAVAALTHALEQLSRARAFMKDVPAAERSEREHAIQALEQRVVALSIESTDIPADHPRATARSDGKGDKGRDGHRRRRGLPAAVGHGKRRAAGLAPAGPAIGDEGRGRGLDGRHAGHAQGPARHGDSGDDDPGAEPSPSASPSPSPSSDGSGDDGHDHSSLHRRSGSHSHRTDGSTTDTTARLSRARFL